MVYSTLRYTNCVPALVGSTFVVTIILSVCYERSADDLHSILALDPGSNVKSPSKRTSERSQNIVPLDPGSVLHRFSGLKGGRSSDRDGEGSKAYHRQHTKKTRRHLRKNRSQYLGRWVLFSLPGHILGHIKLSLRSLESSEGRLGNNTGASVGNRDKGRSGNDGQSEEKT